jgi:membrane protein DedA with SNARE-associated domain
MQNVSGVIPWALTLGYAAMQYPIVWDEHGVLRISRRWFVVGTVMALAVGCKCSKKKQQRRKKQKKKKKKKKGLLTNK